MDWKDFIDHPEIYSRTFDSVHHKYNDVRSLRRISEQIAHRLSAMTGRSRAVDINMMIDRVESILDAYSGVLLEQILSEDSSKFCEMIHSLFIGDNRGLRYIPDNFLRNFHPDMDIYKSEDELTFKTADLEPEKIEINYKKYHQFYYDIDGNVLKIIGVSRIGNEDDLEEYEFSDEYELEEIIVEAEARIEELFNEAPENPLKTSDLPDDAKVKFAPTDDTSSNYLWTTKYV